MSKVFLQRIEISNFRAYGDNFSLSLPGPGVTILTGPGGLGKSTFLEAIEWALTGRIRQLEAVTREKDVPVAQYGVSLEFVNGEGKRTRIERRAVREQENHAQFVEASSPTPQQLMDLLGESLEQAADALTERKRVLSRAEETLNAWQSLDSTATEARARHAATHATLVGLQNRMQAVLEADERRRGAEFKRDTLLRLSAARTKIAQGMTQKSSITARIDRHTHEMWMVQPYIRDTTKTIQRVHDLDNRIRNLLLAKQALEGSQENEESSRRIQSELEAAQADRTQLPDLEYLHEHQAGLKARTAQLASAITEEHKVVAQIEEELLAAQTLQQQHPELLSSLGKLPSDEANAIDEAVHAVEQLVRHERQLVQSEEPFPSVLAKLNEELSKAQATSVHEASEAQGLEQQIANLRQQWLDLGFQGLPSPVAVEELRNKLAEQEAELQQLREQEKRLADTGLSMSMAYWRSRWPALLLEAPLQQHDLNHAAAFIEALRNLVRDRKYQVFLSIHDEELASSMRRKMEEAGIEYVACR
ncbi:AAA family ATPase [Hyalangium versicolor]|uniref:AAA family ATPase n=1 Tax=Hyalangium versicolor TaxID=2861190 RepID=UPI001CCEFBE9|nr:AAA family ATPase [Hyalangium versicolor]